MLGLESYEVCIVIHYCLKILFLDMKKDKNSTNSRIVLEQKKFTEAENKILLSCSKFVKLIKISKVIQINFAPDNPNKNTIFTV